MGSGGYDEIASKLFNELHYRLFFLEYDNERAGDFQALRYLPQDKAVVLGLVTTKHAELEDIQMLKGRVYEAAEVIAKARGVPTKQALSDNLGCSPQCGFASQADGAGVGMSEAIQWKKLELIKRLAEDIWT